MKKAGFVLIILGVLMVLLSAALFCLFLMSPGAEGPAVGIIGGASGPTLWFLFQQSFLWLAEVGIIACVVGLVLILINKVKKDR